jgi:choline monooxygenase
MNDIEQFCPNEGIERAATPPASWYTETAFHSLDLKILKRHWQFVGHAGQLEKVGSYFTGDFAGEPYFVIKTPSGEIKAFANVCRHHAARLLSGEGCTAALVCPYHAWTYNLDGELKRTPHMETAVDFSYEKFSLRPLPLLLWQNFILLNLGGNPKSLNPDWQIFGNHLERMETSRLQFVERRRYEIQCNWKVYVDNYLDGGYHVAHLHRGLAGQLNLKNYQIENYESWTLQSCGGRPTGLEKNQGVDFRDRIGDEALYAWFYPNFMINRYGNIMDTNWVVPLGPDRCATIFDYYFLPPVDVDFKAASFKASEQVQTEDIDICESVQKGLHSSAYNTGRYAPTLETGAFLFHSLLQRDYREANN